jgi:hypothetical protein
VRADAAVVSSRPIVDRVVYGTITIMAVLIIYDGWQKPTLPQVVIVIAGPVLAMFLSHVFATDLATRVAKRRPLTWPERRGVVRNEAPFVLLAVPPILIVLICTSLGVSEELSIRIVVWVGALSFGFGDTSLAVVPTCMVGNSSCW